MPFTLSPLLYSDIPTFATLDEAAMAHWPLAQAMSIGSPLPRKEMIEQWTRQDWGKDPTQRWVKAVDEGGEMVAAALWRVVLDDGAVGDGEVKGKGKAQGQGGDEAMKEEVPAPVELQGAQKKEQGGGEGTKTEKAAPGAIGEEMKKSWEEFRAQHFPNQPYVNLQVLITHPHSQRQGAGTLLTRHITQTADSLGLITVLTSSEAGLKTYLKCGFKVIREWEMDMTRFGVGGKEVRRWMVRQPVRQDA